MRMLAYILIDEGIDTEKGNTIAQKIVEANPNDEDVKKMMLMMTLTKSIPSPPLPKTTMGQFTPLQSAGSDVDRDIPNIKTENPDAIAVIIGNRDYTDKDIPSVDFAVNDAEVLKKYLINVLGYKERNIIFETNASKGRFENIFGTKDDFKGRLYDYLKKGRSDIFVYYSGHGAPDPDTKQGYFIPSDVDSKKIKNGYPLRLLYENVTKIAKEMNTPNIYIVIDSCFSGATEKGSLLKNVSPIGIVVENPLLTMPNAVVMTSSSGTEVSSWYPEMGHSMFTYFFLKALKGGAEKEGQIKLTAGTIFKQIADETEGVPYYARRLHGRVQTPQIMGDEGMILFKK